MATPVDFHPLADADALAARWFYARGGALLVARFLAALDAAVADIGANPGAGSPQLHGTRVWRLSRFPFHLVYVEDPAGVLVVAVAHHRRRPGYWRRRLP
jgi:plasmid stabilization system protein ParE